MWGDPRYDFFIVGPGHAGPHFVVGEARAIQLLPRGVSRVQGYLYLERHAERELFVPTAMLWRKLTIDPWTEAVLGECPHPRRI
jgi:hypothetical protein